MGKKRISNKMEKLLNKQMTREAYQAQVYLAYASWAEVNSFGGVATFLYGHSNEEREHMFKILKYINDRGGEAKIEIVKAPTEIPKDLGDCFNKILHHEMDNSDEIDKIVNLAHEEKDWATFNFGQWFVQEQIEEETLVNSVIDKYTIATKDGNDSIYELDRDLVSASQHAEIPREEKI